MARKTVKLMEDPSCMTEVTAKLSLLQQDIVQIRQHLGLETFERASTAKKKSVYNEAFLRPCPAAGTELQQLRADLGSKVPWSAFKVAMDKLDEMRVFLETAAERIFLGHKQFVLEQLDKKADLEAVNWCLRTKGCDNEVKALRARVEHMERVERRFDASLISLKEELYNMSAFVTPFVLRNTMVCKTLWDLLGLSDPAAKSLVQSFEELTKTCSAVVEQGAAVSGSCADRVAQSAAAGPFDKIAASVVDVVCQGELKAAQTSGEFLKAQEDHKLRQEGGGAFTEKEVDPAAAQAFADLSRRQCDSNDRHQSHAAATPGIQGPVRSDTLYQVETFAEEDPARVADKSWWHFSSLAELLHRRRVQPNPSYINMQNGVTWSSLLHSQKPKPLPGDQRATQEEHSAEMKLTQARQSNSEPCTTENDADAASSRKPAEGILQRLARFQQDLDLMSLGTIAGTTFDVRSRIWKDQVCKRCHLPRGLPNCEDCKASGLPVVPSTYARHAHWQQADDHKIAHLIPQRNAASFFPSFSCVGKTNPEMHTFCCYPRYIEYCLGLLEEKIQGLQEEHASITSLATSILDKKRNDEQKRIPSVDAIAKEVLKRLLCLGLIPLSPTVYQFGQGALQKAVDGTSLHGMQNISPLDKKSVGWSYYGRNGKFPNRKGSSAPCSPRGLLNDSGDEKSPVCSPRSQERTKDSSTWLSCVSTIQKKKTADCAVVFGKQNKNRGPDCPSLAQVVAKDLEESLRRKTHPPPEKPHFWKRHR